MRELYIGGYAQGKLDYVKKLKRGNVLPVDCGLWKGVDVVCWETGAAQGDEGDSDREAMAEKVFYNFHLWVKQLVYTGSDVEGAFRVFLEKFPDWIIISDEVGNGIVPVEKQEREYRECLGRLLIAAAEKADRVERVLCGLGQRIK